MPPGPAPVTAGPPPAARAGRAAGEAPRPCATAFSSIALVLQGGGAMGSYQAGVYEALDERGIAPTWVSGISIGAINAAIIAGNAPAERVRDDGGWSGALAGCWPGDAQRGMLNHLAATTALLRGVPGFFAPRMPPPPLAAPGGAGATSWYDTAALKRTLEKLVDFDRINARELRLSVGAVDVRSGNFAYFDNAGERIRAEHIMASGALPPGFPAVEIDGAHYWDGGLVSNTPLEWVLSAPSQLDTLVLQIDLWSARGALPRDLNEVAIRMKDVQFSSRTRAATDRFREMQKLRAAYAELHARLPDELKATPQARLLAERSNPARYNIVQLVYAPPPYEGQSKDYEFSRRTMEDHWRAGYRDACRSLDHPEVTALPAGEESVAIFDFASQGRKDG